jgi:mono/diheme cytochrome c family protein
MKKALRLLGLAAGGIAGAGALFAVWAFAAAYRGTHRPRSVSLPAVALPARGDARRGRRLVQVRLSCVECHGMDLAGATVVDDPMVASFHGSNLTPFELKTWTDLEIAHAIRDGVARDGRPLLLMPSQDFQHLSARDLGDIIAYLRSVPAVEKPTRPSKLGVVMTALYALGKLPTVTPVDVVDHRAPQAQGPEERVTAEFGAYLARTSCMGCHGRDLKGGPIPGGDPHWPPAAAITRDALGPWTEEGFIKTMRTGVNPSGTALRPPMIVKYTSQFSDTELKALWAYVQSLPATGF